MSDTAPKFTVIGLPNQADFQPGEAVRRVLEAHTVFAGGERHHAIVARWLPAGHRWIDFRSVRALLEKAATSGAPLVVFASGEKKTLGLIYSGSYHFGTGAPERMEIVAGSCRVTLDGQCDARTYTAGQHFDVPGKSGFTIDVATGICEYICS